MLFIAPRYLLPADSGGKIRTGHVLRGLKGAAFELTLISPAPIGAAARDAAELAPLCDRYVSWPEGERSRFFAYTRARHLLSRLPIPVATDISAGGRHVIAAELAREPDLVVVDFPHTAALVPLKLRPPSVLFTHNVEAEIFARHLEVAKNPLLRALWRNQLAKMQRFEKAALRRFDAVIAVSERDQAKFRNEYGVDSATIPTGVDLDQFEFRAPERNGATDPNIVFTASMDSYANIDGMRWFMNEVWPAIAKARSDARMTVVGRKPDPGLVRDALDRRLPWKFTGFIDDIGPYLYDAMVYIIPLRVGGGTRIKAYEAMASGRPVVSTAIGVEGLPLVPGCHYLLGDTAQTFADAVLRLLRDGDLRVSLATEARQLVKSRFSASAVASAFERICLDTLERAFRRRSR
jgi:polysaccharide biosynthesis protein PslH